MELFRPELPAVLKALQGTQQGGDGLPSPAAADASLSTRQRPGVWSVPASVGPDLTKPVVLGEIIAQWRALDETQKVNVLLGIAHMGQGKMHQAAAEARQISHLAKTDASSDWVRTLGCLIGDVGVTGTTSPLQGLDEPTRSEMDKAVAQLATVLEKSSLCLTAPELGYVSTPVARSIAPATARNIYGCQPHARALSRIMAEAKKRVEGMRTPSVSRKQSVAQPFVRRGSAVDPNDSASSSQMGSPEPTSAGTSAFTDLFAEGAGDDNDNDKGSSDENGGSDDDVDGAAVPVLNPYVLRMSVKSSHQADHIGRMARLLVAAGNTSALGGPGGPAQQAATASNAARPPMRGGHPVAGVGMRRGAAAGVGVLNKVGMLAPRRRGAPADIALPGSGPVAGAPRRSASGSTPITHQTKRVQMISMEDPIASIDERDQLLKEQREQAAEKREAARQKQRADMEERKRIRDEARQQKQAAAEAKRQRLQMAAAGSAHSPGSPGAEHDGTASPEPPASGAPAFDVPSEYQTFKGDTPQIESVYADTNVLSDIDRRRMYCFFNARPMPPGTENLLEVTLNERVIDDPANPGKMCTETMIFKANLEDCEWKKVRRFRRS
ncbi:hypothetical protein LPJ61_000550 [Coemansia biformis]|uniref:Uncharacterized protein n=1 Tax=Coemansia biformis TaxID=1286918 RepID=A0A9W7YGU7_9FUNG|nr:hypothetical protein LPJ61_000550 [Coemansia biformis]